MSSNSNYDCQIWFPGPACWELWVSEKGHVEKRAERAPGETLDFDPRANGTRVLALPTSHQVAFPFLSNAMDFTSLQQTAQLHIERQGPGFDADGIMVEPVTGDPPKTIARIDSPLQKANNEFDCDLPELIVPAPAIVPLKRNSASIWQELGDTVVAFERNGKTIFYDKLSGGESIVDELNRLQFQLMTEGLILETERLSVWDERYLRPFENHELFFGLDSRPAPFLQSLNYSMKPLWFREETARKEALLRKKRVSLLVTLGVCALAVSGFLLLVINVLAVNKLKGELAVLEPEANRVTAIQSRWAEVETAVDPEKSYLETWRNLFSLQGIRGVEISKIDIGREGIELQGSSGSAKLALKFIEDVTGNTDLATYNWEYNPPEIDRDGAAKFELKGLR